MAPKNFIALSRARTRIAVAIAFLTHETILSPSGGFSAEAVYLVEERSGAATKSTFFAANRRSRGRPRKIPHPLHQFTAWQMGR